MPEALEQPKWKIPRVKTGVDYPYLSEQLGTQDNMSISPHDKRTVLCLATLASDNNTNPYLLTHIAFKQR